MRKIFLFVSLFPCFLFGQITTLNFNDYQAYSNFTVRAYRYTTSGVTTYTSFNSPYDLITSNLMRMQCGFEITANDPHFLSFTAGNNPLQSAAVDSNIYFISGNDGYRYTIMLIPHLHTLFSTLAFYVLENRHLFKSVSTSHPNYYNIYPFQVVQQIFSGTNDFYKSSVLSSLSALNTSLSSIDNSLLSILSNVQDLRNSVGGKSYTWEQVSNNFVNLVPTFIGNGLNTNYDKVLQELNPSSWDLSDPQQQSEFQALVDSYGRAIDSLSKISGLANVLADPNSPYGVGNGLSQLGNVINGSVDASINDFKRLSTNWQEGVKKDLQDWRNDVTNRLAHMLDDNVPIDGGNANPVFVSGQNGGPVGVAGVVRLEGPISVGATIEGAVTLESSQFNQFSSGWESIKQSIIDFHNTFTDFTTSGDLPFNWISFYRLFYDFQNHSLSNQLALIRSFSVTNILNDIYAAITNNNTNVVLSAMLLDDYETFIDSSKFSDMLLAMPENLASTLRNFGLADSSDYAGRWWVFQTANSMLQSQMFITNATLSALALSALNDIDNSFDDEGSDDKSLLSRWLSLIDDLPDKEELDQAIASASNIVNNVGFDQVNSFYDRATNDFSAAVSQMYQDRSLPTSLIITLVPESHGRPARFVEIPVSERAGLWSLFRSGMAFGLSVVTLILFPKYLLWLLTRYTRLMEKIIKSLKAYNEM